MKHLLYVGVISLFSIISCGTKEEKNKNHHKKTSVNISSEIPTYAQIDVENVFEGEELHLKDPKRVIDFINKYYENIWNTSDMSGGVLIAHGDEVLLEKYKGYGRENNQMPINSETALHIASISKPITAMAIMKLVEAKKISLDQKITTIFPRFPYPKITIAHLLSHRSGLSKYEHFIEETKQKPRNTYYTNQEVLDLFIKNKPELARETDTGFMYNNMNYALLALIIEKITKKSYPEAMKEMVFKPLKMENTFVFEEKHINTASQSFYQRGNKLYPMDEYDLIYGDKNIYTTPRDLLNFSKAMFSKDFLPEELMNKVFEPYSNEKKGVNNYGLGFRLKVFENEKKLIYHTGWWHGSNTIFIHLRESKTTIVALSNKYNRKIYGTLLLSTLFEDFPLDVEKVTNPDAENLEGIETIIEKAENTPKNKKNKSDSIIVEEEQFVKEKNN